MLLDKVYTYLQSVPGVVSLVGSRIYPNALKQAAIMPAIVYQDISTKPNYSHGGDSGLDDALYQFTCWATTPLLAAQLAAQVRSAFGAVTATVSGVKFTGFVENVYPDPEPETGLSRVIVEVSFMHQ